MSLERVGGSRRVPLVASCGVLSMLALSLTLSCATEATAATSGPSTATYLPDEWGLTQIDAQSAWQYGTGSGVDIGIVDTGVDSSHPDLAGKVVASATCINTGGNPSQCVDSEGSGEDDNGHGTHVAGIAAGAGHGIAGVAPGASLVVAKVLDSSGSGSTSDVAAGIEWVVQHGARVVNLSLGSDPGFLGVDCVLGGCNSGTITSAVETAWSAGAIPVIAAGNDAGDLFGPGGYGSLDAVVVGATGPSGQFASDYSSTPGNAKWGVLAPGGDDPNGPTAPTCGTFDPDEIISTYWSNGTSCYATDEGTSMATPFVSGTLALLLGRGLTQQQAVQTLLSTLDTSVTCGSGQGCLGLVNAGAAMAVAAHSTSVPTTTAPLPAIGAPAGSHSVPTTSAPPASTRATTIRSNVATVSTSPPTSTTEKAVLPATAQRSAIRAGPKAPTSARRADSRPHGPSGSGDPPWTLLFVLLGLVLASGATFGTRAYLSARTRKSISQ